jgi:hypothetical protein
MQTSGRVRIEVRAGFTPASRPRAVDRAPTGPNGFPLGPVMGFRASEPQRGRGG